MPPFSLFFPFSFFCNYTQKNKRCSHSDPRIPLSLSLSLPMLSDRLSQNHDPSSKKTHPHVSQQPFHSLRRKREKQEREREKQRPNKHTHTHKKSNPLFFFFFFFVFSNAFVSGFFSFSSSSLTPSFKNKTSVSRKRLHDPLSRG